MRAVLSGEVERPNQVGGRAGKVPCVCGASRVPPALRQAASFQLLAPGNLHNHLVLALYDARCRSCRCTKRFVRSLSLQRLAASERQQQGVDG